MDRALLCPEPQTRSTDAEMSEPGTLPLRAHRPTELPEQRLLEGFLEWGNVTVVALCSVSSPCVPPNLPPAPDLEQISLVVKPLS